MATATAFKELHQRISELEESIVEVVAEIDQTDSNRVALQGTLDSVRETLGNVYGETLTDDVNEYLGIETVDSEIEEEEDED